MDEQKKIYSVIGTVQIGTDEYRDLIESCVESKKEAEENNSKRWEEYRRANKAEDELKAVKAKSELLDAFLKSDAEIMEKYKDWFFEQNRKEVE